MTLDADEITVPVPEVAVCLGTFNRRALLGAALDSIRRSVGELPYVIVVADGGSTDGSRAYLAEQKDVILIGERGPLRGAVRAFNRCFSIALDEASEFIAIMNDDDCFVGPDCEIERAVEMMREDDDLGGVAFEADLRGSWQVERWRDVPTVTKGVIRREAGMAAARGMGDPTGKAWWGHEHGTYAADQDHSLWMWRLGWKIAAGKGLRIHDGHTQDQLARENLKQYRESGTVKIFQDRWNAWGNLYSHDDAVRHGGRLL